MKKLLLLLITSFSFFAFNKKSIANDFSIVGRWKAEDATKEIGYIVFQEDGYAYFEIDGMILGGKDFVHKGKKGSLSYEVDYSTTPITIDLTLTKIDENISKKVFGIAEKLEENKMNLALSFENKRPTDFSGSDSMVFTRVTE